MSFTRLIDRILPQSPDVLLELARTRFSKEMYEAERRILVQTSQGLLESNNTRLADAERMYWSAVADRLCGQTARAIDMYQQAVNRQPGNIEWRMELAQAFREGGRIDDAVREARWCALMAPKQPGLEGLLKDLVREQSIGAGRNDSAGDTGVIPVDSRRGGTSKNESP